jgi:hypothetical protein
MAIASALASAPVLVQRALAASAVSLLVACACLALFLPPMVNATVASVPKTVFIALSMTSAIILHWVFTGIAAQRMGRSPLGWVALALLFPVGGVAALVLLAWFGDEVSLDAAHP